MHYFDNAETDSYTGICDTFYYLFIIFVHCSLQKLKLGAARIFFPHSNTQVENTC